MLLRCINNGGYYLTVGKDYHDVACSDAPSEFFPGKQVFDYYITNDKGHYHGVNKELFVPVSELRDLKLRRLGI